jgi:hypothetical protein
MRILSDKLTAFLAASLAFGAIAGAPVLANRLRDVHFAQSP